MQERRAGGALKIKLESALVKAERGRVIQMVALMTGGGAAQQLFP